MIFAAGLGTRLYPLTKDKPKALAPFLEGTLLEFNLKRLARQGVEKFVINTHHFAKEIEKYLLKEQNFGLDISISHEEILLDTAGGVAKAKELLSEGEESPILLYNVDVISNIDIPALLKNHLAQQNEITLAVRNRITSRYLLFNEAARLVGWENRSTGEFRPSEAIVKDISYAFAFSGIQLVSPGVLDHFEENRIYSLIDLYLEKMDKIKITAFVHDQDYWFDCGKVETLQKAESHLKKLKR